MSTNSFSATGSDPRLTEVVRRLFLVVVPDDATSPERKGSKLAHEVLWGTATATDGAVWKHTQFERCAGVMCSLSATCCVKERCCMAFDPELVAEARGRTVWPGRDLAGGELTRLSTEVRP